MTSTDNFDSYAGLQFHQLERTNPNIYGNNRLRIELGKLGIGTLIIPNPESYDMAQKTVMAHTTEGDEQISLRRLEEVQLEGGGLDVIRSRISLPESLEEYVPILNGLKLRAIGASKMAQYEIASEYMPKTLAVEPGQIPKPSDLEELEGSLLVVKADMSLNSKFVKVAARTEVPSTIVGMRSDFAQYEMEKGKRRSNERIIVQEFVPGLPWSELRGSDESDEQLLKDAETTELRIYCYVDRKKTIPFESRYFATARAMGKGYDKWVSVDQDSVPLAAWEISDEVSDRLLAKANAPGGYFAVDLIKGRAADNLREGIFIREINTRDPLMVEQNDKVHDFMEQRRLLANAMAVMARS